MLGNKYVYFCAFRISELMHEAKTASVPTHCSLIFEIVRIFQ